MLISVKKLLFLEPWQIKCLTFFFNKASHLCQDQGPHVLKLRL